MNHLITYSYFLLTMDMTTPFILNVIYYDENYFGIGRFIANQQNICRVTPVHYLQRAEKKT